MLLGYYLPFDVMTFLLPSWQRHDDITTVFCLSLRADEFITPFFGSVLETWWYHDVFVGVSTIIICISTHKSPYMGQKSTGGIYNIWPFILIYDSVLTYYAIFYANLLQHTDLSICRIFSVFRKTGRICWGNWGIGLLCHHAKGGNSHILRDKW